MSRHDAFREQLALRLYDELSARESAALDLHLADCAACRAFAEELADGLGAVLPSAGSAPDHAAELPADWRARIDRVTSTRERSPVRALATFAAGIAAGILVAVLARGGGSSGAPTERPSGATVRFATNAPSAGASEDALALDAPPPLSTSRAFAGFGRRLRDR